MGFQLPGRTKAVVEYHSLTEENLWDNLKYFLEHYSGGY